MSGKKSRDRGYNHERAMARLLSAIVPEGKVITTRDARGGAQGGNDLCWLLEDGTVRQDVLGWAVECKTTEGLFPTWNTWDKWLMQARLGAVEGSRPVVLYRQHGRQDLWACYGYPVSMLRLVYLDAWFNLISREGER